MKKYFWLVSPKIRQTVLLIITFLILSGCTPTEYSCAELAPQEMIDNMAVRLWAKINPEECLEYRAEEKDELWSRHHPMDRCGAENDLFACNRYYINVCATNVTLCVPNEDLNWTRQINEERWKPMEKE